MPFHDPAPFVLPLCRERKKNNNNPEPAERAISLELALAVCGLLIRVMNMLVAYQSAEKELGP
jgi:hypothetical protein